jgi:hypothetical protein
MLLPELLSRWMEIVNSAVGQTFCTFFWQKMFGYGEKIFF